MNEIGVPNKGGDGYCQYPDCVFAGRAGSGSKNYYCRYYEIMCRCKTTQLPPEKRRDGYCYFYQTDSTVDLDNITAPYGDIQISIIKAYEIGKTDTELARMFNVSILNIIKWRDRNNNPPNRKNNIRVGKRKKYEAD